MRSIAICLILLLLTPAASALLTQSTSGPGPSGLLAWAGMSADMECRGDACSLRVVGEHGPGTVPSVGGHGQLTTTIVRDGVILGDTQELDICDWGAGGSGCETLDYRILARNECLRISVSTQVHPVGSDFYSTEICA